MKLTVKKTIGRRVYPFTFEGDNLFDCIMESQKLSFPDVTVCDCCGGNDLYLSAHIAQDKFKYHEIRCNTCKAELSFGTRTDDPNVSYLQRNDDGSLKWKKYNPNNTGNSNPGNQTNNNAGGNNTKANKVGTKQASAKSQVKTEPKPSQVALNMVTKIAAAGDMTALEKIKNMMKGIAVFTDYDKEYLNTEYRRRMAMLSNGG